LKKKEKEKEKKASSLFESTCCYLSLFRFATTREDQEMTSVLPLASYVIFGH
jgi:hypothetical protein